MIPMVYSLKYWRAINRMLKNEKKTFNDLLRLNKDAVDKINMGSLQLNSLILGCAGMIVLVLGCFFDNESFKVYRIHGCIITIISIAVYVFCLWSGKRQMHFAEVVSLIYISFLLFYFSIFHFVLKPEIPIVFFYGFIVLFPIIYISKHWKIYCIMVFFTAFNIAYSIYTHSLEYMTVIINSVEILTSGIFIGWTIQNTRLKMIDKGRQIEYERDTDPLTNLPNRFKLYEEIEKSSLQGNDNSVLGVYMIDIDFFKKYNDSYGHYAGDICLKNICKCLKTFGFKSGIEFFRYGGEEFIGLVRKNTSSGNFIIDADNFSYNREAVLLLNEIRDLNIPCKSGVAPMVTVSIGFVRKNPLLETTAQELIKYADLALYQSKQKGRNSASEYVYKGHSYE